MTTTTTTPTNHEPMTEGFIFYRSFDEMIDSMPDEGLQLQTYKMIGKYALYGQEPQTDNWLLKALFSAVKPQIDANNKRRANGKKGGRKTTQETAPEVASQPASTAPAAVATEPTGKATTEPNLAEILNQLASQITAAVQAAAQAQSAVQTQPTAQAEPLMQAQPVVRPEPALPAEESVQAEPAMEAQPAAQAEPVMQAQPAMQAASAEPKAVTTTAGDPSSQLDKIIYFGENQYPTTATELGQFQEFARKLFRQYEYGSKPNLADIEQVLERTYTRIERPDGEAIAVFDRAKADLLDYAFEQAQSVGKLSWRYVEGMYRNFLVRGIETGAEARQYDLERAQRFL